MTLTLATARKERQGSYIKRSDAFPSNYLGKDDLPEPLIVTIKNVTQEMIKGDNGEEKKAVAHFTDFPKPMILNLVNWQTIEDAYGDDSDDWPGKRIELYVDQSIMFGGKRVGGVRMRVPMPSRSAIPLSHPSKNGHWTWAMAIQKAMDAGITQPQLAERLKAAGLKGYSPERDTGTVQSIIAEEQAASADEAFDALPSAEEEVQL